MPKKKSRKAVSSRFKITGTGKLKRYRPGKRHILTKKSSNRKRRLRKPGLVAKKQASTYINLMRT